MVPDFFHQLYEIHNEHLRMFPSRKNLPGIAWCPTQPLLAVWYCYFGCNAAHIQLPGMPAVSSYSIFWWKFAPAGCILALVFFSKTLSLMRPFIKTIHIIRTKYFSNLQCAVDVCWLKDHLSLPWTRRLLSPIWFWWFLLKFLRNISWWCKSIHLSLWTMNSCKILQVSRVTWRMASLWNSEQQSKTPLKINGCFT